MTRWYLGLDARAIQDGRHPDFHRGQQAEFVVAFSMPDWETLADGAPSARRVEACRYRLVARVVALTVDGWVLDCGILVHSGVGDPPPGIAVGAWLTGEARLGVGPPGDPGGSADGPALVRSWYVERVHHKVDQQEEMLDPRLAMVEPIEAGWEELAFTDAFHDDDGQATYLLECALVEW